MPTIKRALLSCHDKTGLDVLAKGLAARGVELLASGGTAEFLRRQGLTVRSVEDFTGVGEQLDGRVKTLHPKIHGGILARRDDPSHVASVGAQGLIDLVVVNLYPFETTIQRPGVSVAAAIEQIDIGGVALLRAAAKNFAHVAVACRPEQYAPLLEAIQRGAVPEALARQLATEAFALTSRYDTWIASYLGGQAADGQPDGLPGTASVTVHKRQALRYGENPHQQGAWYAPEGGSPWGFGTLSQLQGKELSYNNLLDIDAAVRVLLEYADPACVIIKHNSQCGLAVAAAPREAYDLAYACDAESAFGGIVGFNRPVDAETAEQLTGTFLEVIVAPSVEAGAAAKLKRKANLRVVTLAWPGGAPAGLEWRQLLGGWVLQERDRPGAASERATVVTKRQPTEPERRDLMFAWCAAKHAQSNGIVLASGQATVGIGQGQPSRVGSVRLALEKAGARARQAVAASDGFFPFPDGVQLLARAGVTAVIQPGGSIRDAEVVATADAAGMAMLVTGTRHFRH